MKKILFVIIAVAMLLAAGCSAPVVKTVVLDAETDQADVGGTTVNKVRNLDESEDSKGISYVGFDEKGKLYGINQFGELFYKDETLKYGTYMDIPGKVLNAEIVDGGKSVLVEALQQGRCNVLLYSAGNTNTPEKIGSYPLQFRTVSPQWKGGAYNACYVTKETNGYVLYTFNGTHTSSIRINENVFSGYRASNIMQNFVLEDAFYIGRDWVAIKVTLNATTYYAVVEVKKGDIVDIAVLESAGGNAEPLFTGIYYIDNEGTLMFYDAEKQVNKEYAYKVKNFDISASAGLLAYVTRDGGAEKVYIMHTDGSHKSLADISSGIANVDISEDGSRLIIEYENEETPAMVYVMEY